MANNSDNDSSLVKLAVAVLDDPHGITTEAWDIFTEAFKQQYGSRCPPAKVQKIMGAINGSDGRVYLPEGWDE